MSTTLSLSLSLVPMIFSIVGMWMIFNKANEHGWAAIIPFYNSYVLFKIVYGNGWLFLLTFIPFGGAIVLLITYYQLAMRFGKSSGFGVGMIFLPWLFLFLLGIENPQYAIGTFQDPNGNLYEQQYVLNGYQGPRPNGKKASIISAIVCGIIGTILVIVIAVVSVFVLRDAYDSGAFDELEEIIESDGTNIPGLLMDDLIDEEEANGGSGLDADGKFKDMAALAEAIAGDLDLGDDSMDVEIYGYDNFLYLDLFYKDEIPDAAVSIIVSALEPAMDAYVEESFGEVWDRVSCEDPCVYITLYDSEYNEIWSKLYEK